MQEEKMEKPAAEDFVYRICPEQEWKSAQVDGALQGGELDSSSGYIHLSTSSQVSLPLTTCFRCCVHQCTKISQFIHSSVQSLEYPNGSSRELQQLYSVCFCTSSRLSTWSCMLVSLFGHVWSSLVQIFPRLNRNEKLLGYPSRPTPAFVEFRHGLWIPQVRSFLLDSSAKMPEKSVERCQERERESTAASFWTENAPAV